MPKGYHVLLGWRLKGIKESLGVMIYDRHLAICVSTPTESLMPEQDLSSRVLLWNLNLKEKCNWKCTYLRHAIGMTPK
jgi:hypothetical protein